MMKTLDRQENFPKNVQNFFQTNIKRKQDAMLLATGFASVSQIANPCQILCCII